MDTKGIMDTLKRSQNTGSIPFKDIEKEFRLIENNTKTIIIPYDDHAKDLIEKLKYIENPKGVIRSLQPYTVSVYEYQYNTLLDSHTIEPVFDEAAVLVDMNQYSDDTGLKTVLETGEAIFM